ncbi:MAG: hypothetical protein Ct9H90mP22_0490 [Gammaproteobacteria bacterium]|nr:MAG: hypothetical protein Ct9H90mP22_0490 [Gammaproteobacteria bacterium]
MRMSLLLNDFLERMLPRSFLSFNRYVWDPEGDALEQKLSNQSIKPKETIFNYSSGFIEGKTGLKVSMMII